MGKLLRVGKLEAARRQLETAILMFFGEVDAVAVHALVGGAYEIIRVLNRSRGGHPMIGDMGVFLKGETRKEFHQHVNKVENFLKHASRDADETLEFDPRWTEARMYEASRAYLAMTEENNPIIEAFLMWFATHHTQMFDKIPEVREALEKIDLSRVRKLTRLEFLTFFLTGP